jgi:hypothetical protein
MRVIIAPGFSRSSAEALHRVRDTRIRLDTFSSNKTDLPVVPICRTHASLIADPNQRHFFRRPAPQEGRFANRHERWRGMRWTRTARKTNVPNRGRRSRVVLISRRWYQVGDDASRIVAGDGGKKARSPRRARRKPLKPFAQGMPDRFGGPVVTTLVCFFILHTRLRVRMTRPAFPVPSVFTREPTMITRARVRRGKAELCIIRYSTLNSAKALTWSSLSPCGRGCASESEGG